uniref:Olfactory receptor n=1 Tax=Geotrypetes seraphini TaxID=260995 RepID=A0A6P8RIJ6_GEOSA|nr:olfactory receptor 52A1-like [Geotrypetes seraphini]
MSFLNSTVRNPSIFILIGIPGLENLHHLIAIPFCVLYIIALLANTAIVTIISITSSLHQPMFIFLAILALNDVLLCTSVVPKMLEIFWFNFREITLESCLTQMFFIHSFTTIESGILLAMAFDRYVAICNPLRYTSILTGKLIAKIGIALIVRATVLIASLLFLLKRFSLYKTNVVSQSYCEHIAILKLVQGDTRINSAYGLVLAFSILGLDVILISVSYIMIFRTVFSLPSREAHLKALNTCTSHICVFLMFYGLGFFSFLSHRYGKNIHSYVHLFLSYLYLLLPPTLNPVVYGVKSKQIRARVLMLLC